MENSGRRHGLGGLSWAQPNQLAAKNPNTAAAEPVNLGETGHAGNC